MSQYIIHSVNFIPSFEVSNVAYGYKVIDKLEKEGLHDEGVFKLCLRPVLLCNIATT